MEGVVCVSLCVEASQKSVSLFVAGVVHFRVEGFRMRFPSHRRDTLRRARRRAVTSLPRARDGPRQPPTAASLPRFRRASKPEKHLGSPGVLRCGNSAPGREPSGRQARVFPTPPHPRPRPTSSMAMVPATQTPDPAVFGAVFVRKSFVIPSTAFTRVDRTHWTLDMRQCVGDASYADVRDVCLFITGTYVFPKS